MVPWYFPFNKRIPFPRFDDRQNLRYHFTHPAPEFCVFSHFLAICQNRTEDVIKAKLCCQIHVASFCPFEWPWLMVGCGLLDKALIYCSSPQTPPSYTKPPPTSGLWRGSDWERISIFCEELFDHTSLMIFPGNPLRWHHLWQAEWGGGVQALGQRNGRIGATGVMNGRRDEEWSGVIQVGRGQTDSEWRRRRRMDGRSGSDADSAERFVLPHTQFVSCRRPLSARRVRVTSISRKTF